jgi:hypothetical protein
VQAKKADLSAFFCLWGLSLSELAVQLNHTLKITFQKQMSNTENQTTEQKRSATIAKKRAQRIAERGYALPLVLTCKVTGKSVKYTSPSYVDKVIAKFGTLEALQAGYVSREGREQKVNA